MAHNTPERKLTEAEVARLNETQAFFQASLKKNVERNNTDPAMLALIALERRRINEIQQLLNANSSHLSLTAPPSPPPTTPPNPPATQADLQTIYELLGELTDTIAERDSFVRLEERFQFRRLLTELLGEAPHNVSPELLPSFRGMAASGPDVAAQTRGDSAGETRTSSVPLEVPAADLPDIQAATSIRAQRRREKKAPVINGIEAAQALFLEKKEPEARRVDDAKDQLRNLLETVEKEAGLAYLAEFIKKTLRHLELLSGEELTDEEKQQLDDMNSEADTVSESASDDQKEAILALSKAAERLRGAKKAETPESLRQLFTAYDRLSSDAKSKLPHASMFLKGERITTPDQSERAFFQETLHEIVKLVYLEWPLDLSALHHLQQDLSARVRTFESSGLISFFSQAEDVLGEIAELNKIIARKLEKFHGPKRKGLNQTLSRSAKDIILKMMTAHGLWGLDLKRETAKILYNDSIELAQKAFYLLD